jgi:hypothetical protein
MSPRLSATERGPAEVYEKEQREMRQKSDAELLKARALGVERCAAVHGSIAVAAGRL